MESMAEPCQHPVLGQADPDVVASPTSLYATRHNPFVYFQAITSSPSCAADDVPLTELPGDLAKVSTTPNFSFITPNLCDDGHDATCAAGGPAGFDGINTFLQTWVPKILGSPAFKKNGLLLITFDEAESCGAAEDDTACCNEPPSISAPGLQNGQAGEGGPGGGRIGLLALSPSSPRGRPRPPPTTTSPCCAASRTSSAYLIWARLPPPVSAPSAPTSSPRRGVDRGNPSRRPVLRPTPPRGLDGGGLVRRDLVVDLGPAAPGAAEPVDDGPGRSAGEAEGPAAQAATSQAWRRLRTSRQVSQRTRRTGRRRRSGTGPGQLALLVRCRRRPPRSRRPGRTEPRLGMMISSMSP